MYESHLGTDLGKLILRLSIGGLLLLHGVHKILHPESLHFIHGSLEAVGWPTWMAYGVYIGEVAAPLMVIFGLMTRLGGLLIATNMLFALYLVHSAELTTLNAHGAWALELQGLYLFGGFAIMAMGPGRFALSR